MSLWWDLPHPNILLYLLQIYISRKYYRYNFSPLWKQDIFTQRQIRQRNFSHNILKTWPYKISAVVISFIKQRGSFYWSRNHFLVGKAIGSWNKIAFILPWEIYYLISHILKYAACPQNGWAVYMFLEETVVISYMEKEPWLIIININQQFHKLNIRYVAWGNFLCSWAKMYSK